MNKELKYIMYVACVQSLLTMSISSFIMVFFFKNIKYINIMHNYINKHGILLCSETKED